MPSKDPDYNKKYYKANREKYSKYQRKHRKKKSEWFFEYKKTLKCKYCPEDCSVCLEFHHTNDNKLWDISSVVREKSQADVIEEIRKCEVVCANCHRKIHAGMSLTEYKHAQRLLG